ncbi:MAG: cysteine desulfurase [Microscillaceae bacterium]|jgi:cysteine desulfurase|nr:cysteine desulfurase [Microscillaceae bacterium]
MKVYLDNAATTPLAKEVLEAMLPYMQDYYGNPSSIHAHGRQTRAAIELARKKIAQLLNTSPSEIFFTSGGTEADNFAICSSIDTFGLRRAITSPLEHHAVLHTLEYLQKTGKIQLDYVEIDAQGNLNYEHLEELLKNNSPALVSLMHANNEIGNLYDIERIGELVKAHQGIYHCDTVQTVGYYTHDLQNLKTDFIVGAGHKFHGPKGVGFMYMNAQSKIHPLIHGGAQERNMRGGTENLYGIIGLAKALELAYENMAATRTHLEGLKKYMIEKLQTNFENIRFNGMSGDMDKSIYRVLNVSFPPSEDSDMVLFNLDINGVSASGGSACSSGSDVGSHVLRALKPEMNRAAVRFSFSKYNTQAEIDYVIEKLLELYPKPVLQS